MKNKKITTVVFDLDGTLLDTLADLADATNHALASCGMPQRTLEEVRAFVGNGVKLLMERAVPGGIGNPRFEEAFREFKRYYVTHCMNKTCLYPGVEDMLVQLCLAGYKLAIVSNKLQSGVDELYEHYFKEWIEVAVGERPDVARKPAPDMVNHALMELGVSCEEAVYVGDSDVDVATARAAGLSCISVLWGFRDKAFLEAHGATTFAAHPVDILKELSVL